jgi:hypothetical protein
MSLNFQIVIFSILAVIFEVRPEYPIDVRKLFTACCSPAPTLRTSALFAIGNLVRSSPEIIPLFVDAGIIEFLQESARGDFCYSFKEIAICISSFITFGGESVLGHFDRPAIAKLLSDAIMLADNPMRSLELEALLCILSSLEATGSVNEIDSVIDGGELLDQS